MYTASTIKSDLFGLIGWRQNPDAAGTQLDAELIATSSGLYFNDVHPLLTNDNLESVAPDFSGFDFSDWLKQKTEAGIIAAVEDWITSKFPTRTAKSLLESKQLYVSGGSQIQDTNNGKVVGLEVVPARQRDVKLVIEQVGIILSEAQTVTVYLYKGGQAAAVQSQAITYSTAETVQWEEVNWSLDADAPYWIVYDQSAISGASINTVKDFSARWRGRITIPMGKFAQSTPFMNVSPLASWEAKNNSYTLGSNYGLNVRYNVKCDYTDFIIRHKNIFKGLISKRVAMDMLRELAYNPNSRVNRHESNISVTQMLYEIDGDSQGRPGGLKDRYMEELKSLQMDQTGINELCLPCARRAVKYGVI